MKPGKFDRLLGIDFGSRRVGLAISDPTLTIASPFQTVTYKDITQLLDKISEVISEFNIKTIIIGYPYGMKGQITPQTDKVKKFIELLKGQTSLPVIKVDERLSSVEARKNLYLAGVKTGHHKARIDKIAAAIILQSYLDKIHTD